MKKLYSCSAIEKLIDKYLKKNGEMVQIEKGVLGYGCLILYGDGLKTAIVKEVFLNEWSSGHTIRFYNKMPIKYKKYVY